MDGSKDNTTWLALQKHSETFKQSNFRLQSLVEADTSRFDTYSIDLEGLLFDYSKNLLSSETLKLLIELAESRGLPGAIAAMFDGEEINNTEKRAALHVALRDPDAASHTPEIATTLERIATLVDAVHSGKWLGHKGDAITDVVNLGIGGSDLGPAMVCDALNAYATDKLTVHFVSNVDPSHLQNTLRGLRAETTLFVIASKSFTTLETLKNAEAARAWLLQTADASATSKHFVAITTNLDAATSFGIDEANLYPLWDWVGGRFSLWSAIGLPIALALGMDGFRQLLAGAHCMDQHFRNTPLANNIPVVSALISYWYREFFDARSTAVVPYSQRLNLLPSFLQQLSMESLGKNVDLEGNPVDYKTGDVIWGTAGTNGQHSYFQLLHQGTEFVPVDFIATANSDVSGQDDAHKHLLANCFSQSLALMVGAGEVSASHKVMPGNKPSNTLLLERLDPYNLGMLLALYEHRVYTLSVIWNINAFDQWGVELGKKLSTEVYATMGEDTDGAKLDASTAGLLARIKRWRDD